MFVDGRGCRSFARVEGDKRPFFSSKQWEDMTRAFGKDGTFTGVRSLVCVHSMSPFFYGTKESAKIGAIHQQTDKVGLGMHAQEQSDYVDLLLDYKSRGNELYVVGGDLHFGVMTDIKHGGKVVFQQMISSAISNSPPPRAVYYPLQRAFSAGENKIVAHPDKGYSFHHTHFEYCRNYGRIVMDLQSGDRPSVRGSLVTDKTAAPTAAAKQ